MLRQKGVSPIDEKGGVPADVRILRNVPDVRILDDVDASDVFANGDADGGDFGVSVAFADDDGLTVEDIVIFFGDAKSFLNHFLCVVAFFDKNWGDAPYGV